jgi:hypothetical protein
MSGFLPTVLVGADDHVQAAHGGAVGIFDELAGAGGDRERRARLGADIGVDVAAREHRRHLAERHAHRRDVLERQTFHPHALEDEHFLGGTGPDADLLALQVLDRLHVGAGLGNHAHAAVGHCAHHDDRFAGGGAQDAGGDAERTEVDRLGDHRVLAVGRAVEGDDLDLQARRRELLVEVRRHRMDEAQRAHLDRLPALRAQDGRRGQGSHGGKAGPGQQTTTIDHEMPPKQFPWKATSVPIVFLNLQRARCRGGAEGA